MTFIAQLPNLELFVQLLSNSGDIVSWCRFATSLLKQSTSLKEIIMFSYDPSFRVAPTPFWFLLRRGDSLPRKLDWPEKKRDRFLMPVNERDASK